MNRLLNIFEEIITFVYNLTKFDKNEIPKPRKIPFSKISRELKNTIMENIDEIGKKVLIPNRFRIFFSRFDRTQRENVEDILKCELEEELQNIAREFDNNNDSFSVEICTDEKLGQGKFYIDCSLQRKVYKPQRTLIEDETNRISEEGMKFLPLISGEATNIIENTRDSKKKNKSFFVMKISFRDRAKYFDLEDRFYTIGRSERCDICLESADHTISRRHIELFFENGRVFMKPLGINGTYKNRVKLELGRQIEICANDRIKVGEYSLEIKLNGRE